MTSLKKLLVHAILCFCNFVWKLVMKCVLEVGGECCSSKGVRVRRVLCVCFCPLGGGGVSPGPGDRGRSLAGILICRADVQRPPLICHVEKSEWLFSCTKGTVLSEII
ncbi:hypothetical protein SLA2020_214560 [Shorea laevis]